MAYAFHVSDPVRTVLGDRTYVTWTVTETEVGTGDGCWWLIDTVPLYFTISLFEAAVIEPSGGTQKINPQLGLAEEWWSHSPSINLVAENLKPLQFIRTGCALKVYAPEHSLYGRSVPAGGPLAKVVTRITIIEGH